MHKRLLLHLLTEGRIEAERLLLACASTEGRVRLGEAWWGQIETRGTAEQRFIVTG